MGGGIFDFERFYGFLVFFGIQRLETCACLTEIHGDSFTAKGWCFGSTTSQRHAAERDGCHPTPMWFGDVSGPRNLDASASNDLSHDKLWMVPSMYHQLLHQNLLLRLIPCFSISNWYLGPRTVKPNKPNRKKKRPDLGKSYTNCMNKLHERRSVTTLHETRHLLPKWPGTVADVDHLLHMRKISKTWCWCPFSFAGKLGHS